MKYVTIPFCREKLSNTRTRYIRLGIKAMHLIMADEYCEELFNEVNKEYANQCIYCIKKTLLSVFKELDLDGEEEVLHLYTVTNPQTLSDIIQDILDGFMLAKNGAMYNCDIYEEDGRLDTVYKSYEPIICDDCDPTEN